jgi:hypothetical protein
LREKGRPVIDFDCPACGQRIEIGDRMEGKKVRCPECDETVRVPEREEEYEERPRKRRRPRRSAAPEDDLAPIEWLLFGLLFLIPCANVVISSVLYYVWKSERPTRAAHVNMLGIGIFVCEFVFFCLIGLIFKR